MKAAFDFDLTEIPKRVASGSGDPWREIAVLALEVMKLKKELSKLKKETENE